MPSDARVLLLKSARNEIEQYGVLDFRISRVATAANCSVTQIYRYFGSRNGIVAQALADLYQEILEISIDAVEQHVKNFDTMTIENVLAMFTGPKEIAAMPMMPVRLQILAVASTIPELEEKISEITQHLYVKWVQLIEEVRERLPKDVILDERAITIDLLLMMPYYAYLMGGLAVSVENYVAWVRHKLFPGQ